MHPVGYFIRRKSAFYLHGITFMLKERGSSNLVKNMGNKGPVLKPRCIGAGRPRAQIPFNSIQYTV